MGKNRDIEGYTEQQRKGFKGNTWVISLWDTLSANASEPPFIQMQAQSNLVCSLVEVSGSSSLPSSSLDVSPNNQRASDIKGH